MTDLLTLSLFWGLCCAVIGVAVVSVFGQELSIFSRSAITTVTLTTNSNTIYGAAFTTIAAAGVWRIRKIAASTWVRLQ